MPQSMPLRPTTIRFAPDTRALVQRAARELGISEAQFVREAAIIRALLVMDTEEERTIRDSLRALLHTDKVEHLARRDDN